MTDSRTEASAEKPTPSRRSTLVASGVMAALFCISFDIARHNDLITGAVAPAQPLDLLVIPAILGVWCIAYRLTVLIDRRFVRRGPRPLSARAKVATCAALLAVWGCYLVVFCPGFIYFDTMNSYWQFTGQITYSNYHPVLYTALVGLLASLPYPQGLPWTFMFFWLGVLQAVFLALIWTHCISWLAARGAPRWLIVFTFLFLLANPVVPLFVILLTSDALFSGLVVLLIPIVYDLVHLPERSVRLGDLMPFLAVSVGICFMRNNGIYVVLFTLFCLLFFFKRGRRAIVGAGVGVAVFWAFVLNVAYPAAGIAEVPFAEAVGIPLQQVGATLADGDGRVTDEQLRFMSNIETTDRLRHTWNPATADGIKYDLGFNDAYLNEHKVEFIKHWFAIGAENPKIYLKAYLMETQGWWDVGVYRWVRIGAGGWTWAPAYNVIDIDLLGDATGLPVRATADAILSEEHLEWVPFANAAGNVWCVALAIVILLRGRREQRPGALALAPLVGIWITLMIASPIFCEFRYVFALCLSWPFLLFLPCHEPASEALRLSDGGRAPEA